MLVKQDVLKRKDSFFSFQHSLLMLNMFLLSGLCAIIFPLSSWSSVREEPAGKVGPSQGKSALEKKAPLC